MAEGYRVARGGMIHFDIGESTRLEKRVGLPDAS